jgi:hypothetical protein
MPDQPDGRFSYSYISNLIALRVICNSASLLVMPQPGRNWAFFTQFLLSHLSILYLTFRFLVSGCEASHGRQVRDRGAVHLVASWYPDGAQRGLSYLQLSILAGAVPVAEIVHLWRSELWLEYTYLIQKDFNIVKTWYKVGKQHCTTWISSGVCIRCSRVQWVLSSSATGCVISCSQVPKEKSSRCGGLGALPWLAFGYPYVCVPCRFVRIWDFPRFDLCHFNLQVLLSYLVWSPQHLRTRGTAFGSVSSTPCIYQDEGHSIRFGLLNTLFFLLILEGFNCKKSNCVSCPTLFSDWRE